ncbi:MAG: type II/IV secretion system protein [Candidatus Omnitrophica bacterium]|nr:type II/IV secretion system protein [Candidatus Omnitrophota bacterium]
MATLKELFDELRVSSGITSREGVRSMEDPFILKLFHLLVSYGVRAGASDLHIEPTVSYGRIRYRIDGLLHELLQVPAEIRDPLLRAIKTKANLATDVVGRSKPQDGRINFETEGKSLDLRLSSFPTLHGDVLAIRILHRSAPLLKLEQIGFPPDIMQQFNQIIHRPNGFVLVTGPAGSGKTTTLYATLEKLRSPHVKVVTLEDPVEYQLEGIDQAQLNPQLGFTFATGLRAILRQDANIILVGEIRDKETVDIAIRAALTGHIVFSTLHTRHACGAVTRLVDMGVEPHLIAASLSGVLAMRLVRVICRHCRISDPQAQKTIERMMKDNGGAALTLTGLTLPPTPTFSRGKGCPECHTTGYRGRSGLFEFFLPKDELREAMLDRAAATQLYRMAVQGGMRTMLRDGIEKVAQGLTTVEEVLRVLGESEDA